MDNRRRLKQEDNVDVGKANTSIATSGVTNVTMLTTVNTCLFLYVLFRIQKAVFGQMAYRH